MSNIEVGVGSAAIIFVFIISDYQIKEEKKNLTTEGVA